MGFFLPVSWSVLHLKAGSPAYRLYGCSLSFALIQEPSIISVLFHTAVVLPTSTFQFLYFITRSFPTLQQPQLVKTLLWLFYFLFCLHQMLPWMQFCLWSSWCLGRQEVPGRAPLCLDVWNEPRFPVCGKWLQREPRLRHSCPRPAAISGFVCDALRVLHTLILSPESCCSGLCHAWPQGLHRLKLDVWKGGREINISPSRGTFQSRWGGAILKLRLREGYFCPSARQTQLMVYIVQTIFLTRFLKRWTKTSRKSP